MDLQQLTGPPDRAPEGLLHVQGFASFTVPETLVWTAAADGASAAERAEKDEGQGSRSSVQGLGLRVQRPGLWRHGPAFSRTVPHFSLFFGRYRHD